MEHPDTLVLNQHTKRRFTDPLRCYNCGENFYPNQGQGSKTPSRFNAEGREFCDIACQLSYAQGSLDGFDYADCHTEICAQLGREPYVPPPFPCLVRFGGNWTIEEYKWGQHPVNQASSKRVRFTLDTTPEENNA